MDVLEREILEPPARGNAGPVGVFLGVHGEAWLGNAIESIERQDSPCLDVVVAINGAQGRELDVLIPWQRETRHRVTLTLNAQNLGPIGSWQTNIGLLSTTWVAVFHQDDVYLDHHIPVIQEAVSAAPADILAVFTQLDGISPDGAKPSAPPLVMNEHLDGTPSAQLLPEIIGRHPVATPTVAFRNPAGIVRGLAWYDSGAPDSEWFAHLACRGRFRILPEVTVRYRVSPDSESQSTGWQSRAWQWAQSLDRFIHSEDFGAFLADLPVNERWRFSEDFLAAVPARYPASPIFGFLAFATAQRMAEAWDYMPGPATQLIGNYLATDAASAAVRNLSAITGTQMGQPGEGIRTSVDSLLGTPPHRGRIEAVGRATYRRWGHLIPPAARMRAFKAYQKVWPRRGAR